MEIGLIFGMFSKSSTVKFNELTVWPRIANIVNNKRPKIIRGDKLEG